jgi:hypothetical protein
MLTGVREEEGVDLSKGWCAIFYSSKNGLERVGCIQYMPCPSQKMIIFWCTNIYDVFLSLCLLDFGCLNYNDV